MLKDYFKNNTFPKDSLTGLFSREVLVNLGQELIKKNIPFCIGIIDIDNFKYVNDTYGHQVGDKIIIAIANSIRNFFGETALVGRFGGDEYLFILPKCTEYDMVWKTCSTLLAGINNLRFDNFPDLFITCTLGLSRFPLDAENYETLMETADKALYRGKTKGRSCFIIYLKEKHANIQLNSEKSAALSSMFLHTNIFRTLSTDFSLATRIEKLFTFLSSHLMLDHICIQTENSLLLQKIHELSRSKNFKVIDSKYLKKNINRATEIFYINDYEQLIRCSQNELSDLLKEQGIISTFYCEISHKNNLYGYLRVDVTSNRRIWQYSDMDLLVTTAKLIAMQLFHENKKLEDL